MPYRKIARKTTKPKRKYVVKKVAPKMSLDKRILKVVKRTQEVKQFNTELVDNVPLTYWASPGATTLTSFDLINNFLDQISVGAGDGERVGDKVNTRRFQITGFLNFDISTLTPGNQPVPQNIRMIVFKDKQNEDIAANNFTDIFEGLAAGVSTPKNSLQDMIRRINNERYTVLAQRRFKIGPANLVTTGPTGPPYPTSYLGNNDYKMSQFFKIDLTKQVGRLVYDTISNQVKNHPSLHVMLFACPADGSAANPAVISPGVSYSMVGEYSYTDS